MTQIRSVRTNLREPYRDVAEIAGERIEREGERARVAYRPAGKQISIIVRSLSILGRPLHRREREREDREDRGGERANDGSIRGRNVYACKLLSIGELDQYMSGRSRANPQAADAFLRARYRPFTCNRENVSRVAPRERERERLQKFGHTPAARVFVCAMRFCAIKWSKWSNERTVNRGCLGN